MPAKYTKKQRKTRRRAYRRQREGVTGFTSLGKMLTAKKRSKIAKARYKAIFD